MNKKQTNGRHRPKKEVDEAAMAHFGESAPAEHNSSRRRLKKHAEVNKEEEVIDPELTQKLSEDEEEEEPQYQQFDLKDDEDIRKEQEVKDKKKASKSTKGNHMLDSFLSKRGAKEAKPSVQERPQKVQLTLEEMARIKKEQRQQRQMRKSSQEFVLNDSASLSVEDHRPDRFQKAQEFNGPTTDENKLIEKAIQLSLTAASDTKGSMFDEEVKRKINPYKSQEDRPAQKRQKGKSKSRTKVKAEVREGPLSDMVIAFTGEFENYRKEELIEICTKLGAECPKSLTRKVNLLMQGDFAMDHFKRKMAGSIEETGKSKEARERKIAIVTSRDLEQFFIDRTTFSLEHHIDDKRGKRHQPPSDGPFHQRPMSHVFANNSSFDSKGNSSHQEPACKQKQENNTFQSQKQYEEHHRDDNQHQQHQKRYCHGSSADHGFDSRLWTEKYKPDRLTDVVGESSQIRQLNEWIEAWEDIHFRGNKREVKQARGWGAAGSINSKAALLSGDPGIGKTTTARLLAMEQNYLVSEFNASDIRNKSGISLMESGSFSLDGAKNIQKSLIIMDQVDGMSSGDRGGVQAIIQMIKNSKVPIICICNDRSSEKIRSLAVHCFDVRFHKPTKSVIVKRLQDILVNEGGRGDERALDLLVETFQNDMRQILSYLQLIFQTTSKHITLEVLSSRNKHAKDSSVMSNAADAVRKLMNRSEFEQMRIPERTECFFVDSDMVPLMIHENLLTSSKKGKMNLQQFHSLVQGLEGFVVGDMLDRSIRKQQEWGLMPSYGFMTSVYATQKISDSIGFPAFPSWLGKNSSERKNKRLTRQFKNAIFPMTTCSSFKTIKNNYSSLLMEELVAMLKKENIQGAVELMEGYRLTPLILNEHLSSLTALSSKISPLAAIPPAIKAKLTRLFNKRHEDAKLSKKTGKAATQEHAKFNTVLEELEAEDEEEGQGNGSQAEEEVEKKAAKAKKGKKK